jgi:hypothetical protein
MRDAERAATTLDRLVGGRRRVGRRQFSTTAMGLGLGLVRPGRDSRSPAPCEEAASRERGNSPAAAISHDSAHDDTESTAAAMDHG